MKLTTLSLIQFLTHVSGRGSVKGGVLQSEVQSSIPLGGSAVQKVGIGSVTSASLMPNSSGGRVISKSSRSPLYLMPTTSVPLAPLGNTSTVLGSNSPGAGLLGVVSTLKSLRGSVSRSRSANNLPASQKKSVASRFNEPLTSNISCLSLSTIILALGLLGSAIKP